MVGELLNEAFQQRLFLGGILLGIDLLQYLPLLRIGFHQELL
jgi:hypothetical protein